MFGHRRNLRPWIVLAALALVAAACADGIDEAADPPEEPDLVEPEGPDEPDDEAAPEPEEPTGEGADPEESGAALRVDPACAEIGDGFTATAIGLEAGAAYDVLIDPPFSPGAEAGTMGEADADGVLEVPANLPEDSEAGSYVVTVAKAGEELATAEMEIAETCPTS